MGQITVTTRQKRDPWNHKLRLDDLENPSLPTLVTNGFCHHPREPKGNTVLDLILCFGTTSWRDDW